MLISLHLCCLAGLAGARTPMPVALGCGLALAASAQVALRRTRDAVGWRMIPSVPPTLESPHQSRMIVHAALSGPAAWMTWVDERGRRGRLMVLADSFLHAEDWRRARVVLRHGVAGADEGG